MKRSESLAPLSREHHTALILAQLLKKGSPEYKGLPTGTREKVAYAKQMFIDSLKEHFQKEELLLGKVEHFHEDIKQLGEEILSEHQHLERSFIGLGTAVNIEDAMNNLGNDLDKHIRKEERILFPLIQKHCPEDVLREIDLK